MIGSPEAVRKSTKIHQHLVYLLSQIVCHLNGAIVEEGRIDVAEPTSSM